MSLRSCVTIYPSWRNPPYMWGWILFWSFMLNNHYTREEPSHDTKPRVHHHYAAWLTIAVLSAIALLNFVADQ